jgi:hypothetical protein
MAMEYKIAEPSVAVNPLEQKQFTGFNTSVMRTKKNMLSLSCEKLFAEQVERRRRFFAQDDKRMLLLDELR